MNHLKRARQIIASVGAAMLGVQSKEKAETDFGATSIVPYVIVGIIFVLIFIATLITIVNLVI